MTPAILFLGFIIAQRLSELVIARRNTAALLAAGATEVGAGHYPVMVLMHAGWIGALVIFGWQNPVSVPWLVAFVLLQGLRIWILATLGRRWTTRIIVSPQPLVAAGPYRYLRHPNYVLVVAEILVAPMVLGLVWVAVVWTVLNAAMLYVRIRAENAALAPLHDTIGNSKA
jgi:methyltransferase